MLTEQITRENCGSLLSEVRARHGLSLADLAGAIGVSRSTVLRIEEERTLPSDDFLNRLKAIQLIGLSKFAQLREKDKLRFTESVKEVGEDPENLKKILDKGLLRSLTPLGVLAGLGTLGGASFVATATIASVPLVASLAGIGLIKALKQVTEANGLKCKEIDGRWEIQRSSDEDSET
jgi:transcriptional regulator with XRE-family HTH domain